MLLLLPVFQYDIFALLWPAVAKLCSRVDSLLCPSCSPFSHLTLWAYMACGEFLHLMSIQGVIAQLALVPYCDLASVMKSMQTFHSLFRRIFTSAIPSCMNGLLSWSEGDIVKGRTRFWFFFKLTNFPWKRTDYKCKGIWYLHILCMGRDTWSELTQTEAIRKTDI